MTAQDWNERFIVASETGEWRAIFGDFCRLTFSLGASGDLSLIDEIFEIIDPKVVYSGLIAGLLRSTYRLSSHLKNWISLRDKVLKHLEDEGIDPSRLMVGMLPDTYKPYKDYFGLDHLIGVHPSLRSDK